MKRFLRGGFQETIIANRDEPVGDGYVPKIFYFSPDAYNFLLPFMCDPHNISIFREFINNEAQACMNYSLWRNHDIIEKISHLVASGRIIIAVKKLRDPKEDTRKRIIKAHNIVKRSTWGKQKPKYNQMDSDWNYTVIAVHHSGDGGAKKATEIESKHMSEWNWDDVGYHYLIAPDGKIYEGRKIYYKGSHVGGANTGKIGILVMGDFHHQLLDFDDDPTTAQINSLVALSKTLKKEFQITTLGGHRDWTDSVCPGDVLYNQLDNIRTQVGGVNAP